MSDKMTARPATPGLNLLNALTDEVFLPAGVVKLASAGQQPANMNDVTEALSIGMQVANAIQAKQATGNATPLSTHASKVAAILDGATGSKQVDAIINGQIDASPELSEKFAAAFVGKAASEEAPAEGGEAAAE